MTDSTTENGAPLRQSTYTAIEDAGVQPGTFGGALGVPDAALEAESGDGIEVHRADFTEVMKDVEPRNSVSISLWRGSRCTTLDQSWDDGDSQDYLDAVRALALQAEELIENERL